MKCYICGDGSMSYEPSPAVAWLRVHPSGNTIHVCQTDLNYWFDDSDRDPDLEPVAWGWLPGREPATA